MERIVIFGATGDLTARYLIPALAKLYEEGKLAGDIKITGVDRKRWDDNPTARASPRRDEATDGFRRMAAALPDPAAWLAGGHEAGSGAEYRGRAEP